MYRYAKRFAVLIAVAASFALTGCTLFQDDIYRAQSGQTFSSAYDNVDDAIHDEFVERFGEGSVFRADVEWKYDQWTAVSEQRAIGHEKYRVRVHAYPQLDQDGMYEPVVIAHQEVYTGYGYGRGRGGPTAMYSGKWTEAGRDVDLEVALANAIYNRLHGAEKEAGGR